MKKPIAIMIVPALLMAGSFAFAPAQKDKGLQESMKRGEELYISNCVSCHMKNGQGLAKVFPPLAGSDYMQADQTRAIRQVLYGAKGEMVVNGITYNGEMSGFDLGDESVADLMNYIQNSWGNEAKMVKPEDVKEARN